MRIPLWPMEMCDISQSYRTPADDVLADTAGDGTVTPRDSTP